MGPENTVRKCTFGKEEFMETITTIFDLGLYLTGVLMALIVALFICVAGYELTRSAIKNTMFARKMRRRMKNA